MRQNRDCLMRFHINTLIEGEIEVLFMGDMVICILHIILSTVTPKRYELKKYTLEILREHTIIGRTNCINGLSIT